MQDDQEDSWGEELQKPLPEEDPTTHAGSSNPEPPLRVPVDQQKSGETKVKKGIPKWQWGLLAGLGVVAVGGGAAFAFLGMHHESQMSPVQLAPHEMHGPSVPPPFHAGGPAPKAPETPKAAAMLSAPAAPAAKGFATLNALPGSSPTASPASGGNNSAMMPPVSGAAASVSGGTQSEAAVSGMQMPDSSAGATQSAAAPAQSSDVPSGASSSVAAMVASSTSTSATTPNQSASDTPPDQSATASPAVARLKMQIAHSKRVIARLQKELQAEKMAQQSTTVAQPKVITRTIVRYVHVPVAAPRPAPVQHQGMVGQNSGGMGGWHIVGGEAHIAMIAGPDGKVISVKAGDILPGGGLVQRVTMGEVFTSNGVIH